MQTLFEVATYDVTVPVVVGVLFFGVLMAGLAFVRQVGKSRPHSRTTDE
jgi:hypothetical protein